MGTIYRNGTAFIGSGGAGGVELTQAEYDALPTTEKMNGSIYFISDGETSYPSASTMRYDNSTSGLTATSVQDAVDEVNDKVNDNAGDIAELNNGLTNKTSGVVTTNRSDVSISRNGCIRCADVVIASAMLTGSTPATGSFFNIPSGFRPNQTIAVPVFFTINGVEHTELGTISADGSVAMVYSSSQQVSRIFFSTCYHV